MDIEANQVDEVQAGILINVTTSFVITYIILFGLMYISGEGFTSLGQRKNSKQKI